MAEQLKVISCCLILVNAIVSYRFNEEPGGDDKKGATDDLKRRLKLRAEFIRLQMLDVLSALHREKHVDVVRQVEVFEQEMQADNEEVTLMTKEEQALAADQPASLNLERSASMESVGDGEKPRRPRPRRARRRWACRSRCCSSGDRPAGRAAEAALAPPPSRRSPTTTRGWRGGRSSRRSSATR